MIRTYQYSFTTAEWRNIFCTHDLESYFGPVLVLPKRKKKQGYMGSFWMVLNG